MKQENETIIPAREAVLVAVIRDQQQERQAAEYLDELEFLAETAGIASVKRFTQRLANPSSKTFVGEGKLAEIAAYVEEHEIAYVIFDDELTPSQLRNLDRIFKNKIYDRTSLILDIFVQRATTAYAKAQVELAQCQYLLPRLTGMWTHLERQRGGTGTRGGAGEREIETDRRVIRDRISRLKEQLKKINEQLSRLGVQFGNNLLADNNAFTLVIDKQEDLAGVPASIQSAASTEAVNRKMEGKWVFTLSKPSMIPFLSYSERRDLREKLYKAYLERCNRGDSTDNKQIVNEIAKLRLEKARLMGYPSYGAFALDDEMAQTPENAYALLDKLWQPSLELAKKELEEMKAIKKAETGDDSFESWDWWYYAEKVRKQKYDLNEEMLRPYLSLDNVVQGIFQLSNRLWGITFRPVSVPVYHKECIAYEVLDKDNKHLGILYFDFFPRPGKQGGAWCGAYREERYEEGKRIAPVVTIVANVSRPATPNGVALLNLDETETLFHEFGHALHSLFSQVHYAGIGGVEQDFVELPSQLMENWAFEPDMLRMYAKHYQTGDPMPDDLIEKIQRSALFNQGFTTTELLAASLSDMDIHTITEYRPIDLNAFEKEMLNGKRGLIPQIEPRYRYPYFAHIFGGGYAAGYYSYIWAEVLDKDAYEAFVESGDIFDRTTAESYRKNILERGGSEGGMELYKKFRGHEPDIKPLMIKRGLIEMPADTAARPAPLDTAARNASIRRIIGQQ